MGTNYRSYALLGVAVDPVAVYQFVKVKAFEHWHPEDWQVDPLSGRKLWHTERRLRNEVERVAGNLQEDLAGDQRFRLYASRTRYGKDLPDTVIIAIHVAQSGWSSIGDLMGSNSANLPDLQGKETELRNFLEPLGLWPKEGLQLFAVTDVSV